MSSEFSTRMRQNSSDCPWVDSRLTERSWLACFGTPTTPHPCSVTKGCANTIVEFDVPDHWTMTIRLCIYRHDVRDVRGPLQPSACGGARERSARRWRRRWRLGRNRDILWRGKCSLTRVLGCDEQGNPGAANRD